MNKLSYKRFFKTLANENRLKIIKFLQTGPKSVTEIVDGAKLEQSLVSHSLKRLLECHFVEVNINGKERIYELNQKTIKPLLLLIDEHVKDYCVHCDKCLEEYGYKT